MRNQTATEKKVSGITSLITTDVDSRKKADTVRPTAREYPGNWLTTSSLRVVQM